MLAVAPLIIIPNVLLGQRAAAHFTAFILKIWASAFTFPMLSFTYSVKGKQNLQKGKAYIYIGNHNSFLDSPACIYAVPGAVKPLGKIEITKVPIFGYLYRYMVVIVDRKSASSRKTSLLRLKQMLQSGISVLVFPEGTQNRSAQPLQPFYDGAFKLAMDTGYDIAPFLIRNTRKLWSADDGMRFKPGNIEVEFLPTIPASTFQNLTIAELKAQTYELMQQALLTNKWIFTKSPLLPAQKILQPITNCVGPF